MHRNEYMGAPMSPSLQAAYQHELLRRSFLLSSGTDKRRLHPEIESKLLLNDRRHSLGTQPDFPIYPKFVYSGGYDPGTSESLLDSEYDDVAAANMTNILSHRGAQRVFYVDGGEGVANATASPEPQIINRERVVHNLTVLGRFLEMIQSWPLPRLSFTTACICFLLAIFVSPRSCVQSILFPAFRLSFGTLYPAYASYKAVRTKNVKEYVKWMMYWIVYAFFTCIETFTDIFLSWFPFYYEVKVVIVLWLLSPATKGSSTLYRKFVHPMLTRREQEIDEYLNQAKERGYSAVLQLGSKGVNYATNVIMQTALKGGGNLVQTLRRSYSLSDLSEPDVHRTQDEIDDVSVARPQQRILRPRLQTAVGRSASGTRHSTGMYFTEMDVGGKGDFNYNIRSSEDISSGYSSAEPVSTGLSRTSSMTNASKARLKSKRAEMNEVDPQTALLEQAYFPNVYMPASILADWKDDVFMENEFYFQNVSLPIPETKLQDRNSPMPISTQPETGLTTFQTEMSEPNIASSRRAMPINQTEPTSSIKLPEQDNCAIATTPTPQKEMECFVFNLESKTSTETQIHTEKSQLEQESDDDDEFLDTISVTSMEISESQNAHDSIKDQDSALKEPVITPRQLRETLEEIKDTFRATIEAPPIQPRKKEDEIEENAVRRSLSHNKGKAPAPPLPPHSPHPPKSEQSASQPDVASLSSFSSISSSRSTSPSASTRKSIFKNIRSNIFRHNTDNNKRSINSTADRSVKRSTSFSRETEI